MYTRIFPTRKFSSLLPPAARTSYEKFFTLAKVDASIMRYILQHAAIPPIMMKIIPRSQPLRASTYGRESTPEPIAAAQREKILPLREPFARGPKVRFK